MHDVLHQRTFVPTSCGPAQPRGGGSSGAEEGEIGIDTNSEGRLPDTAAESGSIPTDGTTYPALHGTVVRQGVCDVDDSHGFSTGGTVLLSAPAAGPPVIPAIADMVEEATSGLPVASCSTVSHKALPPASVSWKAKIPAKRAAAMRCNMLVIWVDGGESSTGLRCVVYRRRETAGAR